MLDTQICKELELPTFMESEVSFPCSQEPSTGPYPKPDLSST
jgi:hypothetical protein